MNIPIGLLNRLLSDEIMKMFNFEAGRIAVCSPIVTVMPSGVQEG
jgi:hypothetical protein